MDRTEPPHRAAPLLPPPPGAPPPQLPPPHVPPPAAHAGPPAPRPAMVVLAVLGVVAGALAAAVIFALGWLESCGPGMFGQSEGGPPEIESLRFTVGAYVVAFVVAASVPAIGLSVAARRGATALVVVWAALLAGAALLIGPPTVDAATALVADQPGDYCVQRGYQGG